MKSMWKSLKYYLFLVQSASGLSSLRLLVSQFKKIMQWIPFELQYQGLSINILNHGDPKAQSTGFFKSLI